MQPPSLDVVNDDAVHIGIEGSHIFHKIQCIRTAVERSFVVIIHHGEFLNQLAVDRNAGADPDIIEHRINLAAGLLNHLVAVSGSSLLG
ncbi:hypothetical protein D3C73_871770 [compost metagenome]